VGRDEKLASSSTVGRLDRRADRDTAWLIHEAIFESFVDSFSEAPEELVLDFDATDDPVHGKQEGRFFHGYYDHYCFLPLYVFCGSRLLAAYLRPSNIDGAKHAWAILSLLVKRLREVWPEVRIILRADSGFCRHRMLDWCDRKGVGYVVGLAKNSVLLREVEPLLDEVERLHEESGQAERLFGEFRYAAQTWRHDRRTVVKAEHLRKGSNPRFVVTNLDMPAKELYENLYCARGDMENRIKEQQLGLFADRTSSTSWWANQFRLLLSSLAYVLIEHVRRVGLHGTALATAQVSTLRTKLFKLGAVIVRNTRRVRLMLATAFPLQDEFWIAAWRLSA
jgi:hypothetical protein